MYASALPLNLLMGVRTIQRFSGGVPQALDLEYQLGHTAIVNIFTTVRSPASPRSDALPSEPLRSCSCTK